MRKNNYLFGAALMAATLATAPTTALLAQDEVAPETVDLEVWYVHGIQGSAQQNVHPTFRVNNLGKAVQNFTVEVTLNDKAAFTEEITLEAPLAYNEWADVTTQQAVTLPFGETSTVGITIKADGDVDETNNSGQTTVEMPSVLEFPYTWNVETCQQDFDAPGGDFWFGLPGWEWNTEQEAFYLYGKGTNWMSDITSQVVDFPADAKVMISFESAISLDGTMTVKVDYGGGEVETLTADLTGNGEFAQYFVSFTAKGPARVAFSPRMNDIMQYGGVYVRNINMLRAQRDMAAGSILQPATSQVALSDEPVSVTVRFRNVSPFDIENPTFCYDAGDGQEVREVYEGTVLGGTSVDYTFTKGFVRTTEGTVRLKAWCEVARDANPDNNSVEKEMTFYVAPSFPYQTTFDEGNDLWSAIGNGAWGFAAMTDGNNVMVGQQGTIVTPAIKMPAGVARVSFYYGSVNRAGANLKLYMGRGTGEADLQEVLFDKDITNGGWLNGYHLLNIEEPGNYYFAFRLEGAQDQVVIDNFKVDAEEDLCMHSVGFDRESGFNLTEAKVTLSYVNHGVTPQKDIAVRYYINSTTENYVEETVTDVVMPGDTLSYTFQKPVDVSATDSVYTVLGQIVTKVGNDQVNDFIQGASIQNFKPLGAPYYYDFADDVRNGQWLMPENDGNKWGIEDYYFTYDGSRALTHHHSQYTYTEPADDWAYSECLELEPGEYYVSFFHRGRTYFSGEEYNQSYELKMGRERTPEAMTIDVARYENVDIYGQSFQRSMARVKITEGGQYYLGFHNFSPANDGETRIDGVSIERVEPGLQLPYASNFAEGTEGWTLYNAGATDYFTKWENVDGMMTVTNAYYVENLLVSPKLAVKAGQTVVVEVEYAIVDDAEVENLALDLYTGELNSDEHMTVVASGAKDQNVLTYQFTADKDQDLYVGLRTNTDIVDGDYGYNAYQVNVKSVKVSLDITDGINTALRQESSSDECFDLQGRRVAQPQRGLYIRNGRKVVVK